MTQQELSKLLTLLELQKQVLQLPIKERWHLVESVLASIQQETLSSIAGSPTLEPLTDLDPWVQSLIGVIQLEQENPIETYVDYLD
ncbi:MAG TPA: hypothetical protein VE944_07530 [Nostoc sp.]|uniref:hypothetical protein n=1 Tax=Nostoc sp. TaxID=1180 RepID=UPI002D3ACE91|nr:hypothetical protein [Nostoc sp.]HYX14206.1 hypothetical protein [Nostoc sp.]